jgi:hypothetical protein
MKIILDLKDDISLEILQAALILPDARRISHYIQGKLGVVLEHDEIKSVLSVLFHEAKKPSDRCKECEYRNSKDGIPTCTAPIAPPYFCPSPIPDSESKFNGAKAGGPDSDATYSPRGAGSPAQPGTASAGQQPAPGPFDRMRNVSGAEFWEGVVGPAPRCLKCNKPLDAAGACRNPGCGLEVPAPATDSHSIIKTAICHSPKSPGIVCIKEKCKQWLGEDRCEYSGPSQAYAEKEQESESK